LQTHVAIIFTQVLLVLHGKGGFLDNSKYWSSLLNSEHADVDYLLVNMIAVILL